MASESTREGPALGGKAKRGKRSAFYFCTLAEKKAAVCCGVDPTMLPVDTEGSAETASYSTRDRQRTGLEVLADIEEAVLRAQTGRASVPGHSGARESNRRPTQENEFPASWSGWQ